MTDEMKKLVEEALRFLVESLKGTAGFAQAQMPDIIQQKLTYDFYWYVFFTGICVVLMVASVVWLSYCETKRAQNSSYNDEEWYVAGILPTRIILIVGSVSILNNISYMLQIHFAPKLYILEWLKSFLG